MAARGRFSFDLIAQNMYNSRNETKGGGGVDGYGRKSERIAGEVRAAILAGRFRPGERIESENELAARYQVSRQTVRKALATLIEQGYLRAEHGRGTFVTERSRPGSKTIAVVITYLADYIFPRVIQGIDQELAEHGYSILLKSTRNSRHLEARYLEELAEKEIDGLIIEPSKSQIFCRHTQLYERFDARGVPYVFIQGCFEAMRDRPHVLLDDAGGAALAARHLLSLGHRRIAGIFKADDTQGVERHRGYVRALQEAGVLYDPDLVLWYHTEDRAVAPAAGAAVLARRGMMDAAVCYNDEIAVAVIRALENEGLRVPEDISVTGYDNSLLAENFKMGLTTVSHPHEELGRAAARLLLSLIAGERVETAVILRPELIVRGSTAPKR